MRLATGQDVQAALGRELTGQETAAVAGLLDEATDSVVCHLWPYQVRTPTPAAIVRAFASMTAAVLTRPAAIPYEATQLTADVFSASFAPGTTSPGPHLTAAIKQRLKLFRTGMVSVAMGSERY